MFLVLSCRCLCPIHWSQVLSRELRSSWSCADRRCSNYIWVINNFFAYKGATYIADVLISNEIHYVNWSKVFFLQWCVNMMECFYTYLPTFKEVERGYTGFTLSVCGQNHVCSVSSKIVARSISYLHILSSNLRRCVACKVCFKFCLKFWQILQICNFDFVFFWLGIQYDSIVWVIMRRPGVSSERRRSSCSSRVWSFCIENGFKTHQQIIITGGLWYPPERNFTSAHELHLNQCWYIVAWTVSNKLQWILIAIHTFSFKKKKCIWKYGLVNGRHFVSASVCKLHDRLPRW